MRVDEIGKIWPPEDKSEDRDEVYTPNFVFAPRASGDAVQLAMDTKGFMSAAMGRTIVGVMIDALASARIPAHIGGWMSDLIALGTFPD
ncbi:hypothetical protein [Solirubrobacter soli]|uniref:hypothetical protein n=1 Tax=Solirubrobacter soli TaxID=363832 RepID=UPI00041D8C07|nr:hypothetical protein [Solirubrobacter soli]